MPNPAEQAQLIENVEHKCYLRFGGDWRVEVNCGYIGLYIHTVMPPCPQWWAVTTGYSFSSDTLSPQNNCLSCQR